MGIRRLGPLAAVAITAGIGLSMAVPAAAQNQENVVSAPAGLAGQGEGRVFRPIACPDVKDFAAFHRCALEKMKTFKPRRTSDGKPDIGGLWDRSRAAMDIEEVYGQYGGEGTGASIEPSKSLIVDPPNGKIPYQPWAGEIRRKIASFSSPTTTTVANPADKQYAFVSPSAMCFQLGPQRQAYSANTHILQQPNLIVFFKERAHTHRLVPLDRRPHVGQKIRLWGGDSRGRWEGNTLVIETTNLNDFTWFDHIGTFMTENAVLVERITPIDENTIHYEETITDPAVFTQPWKIVLAWQRSAAKGADAEVWYNDLRENCHLNLDVQYNLGLKPYPGFRFLAPKK